VPTGRQLRFLKQIAHGPPFNLPIKQQKELNHDAINTILFEKISLCLATLFGEYCTESPRRGYDTWTISHDVTGGLDGHDD
jgi:hypothetical protein